MSRRNAGGATQLQAVPTQCVPLTYYPLPLRTHTNDWVTQPQGWGPFAGPWNPDQFADPAACISIQWVPFDATPQIVNHAPGYDDVTVFRDPSLSGVNNQSFVSAIRDALSDASERVTSTISNAPGLRSVGMRRLADALGLGQKAQPGGTS